jgi:hypothetical protein
LMIGQSLELISPGTHPPEPDGRDDRHG